MEGRGLAHGKLTSMYDLIWLAGFIIVWLLLQLVVLPRLGFST
jgi:hypothetical protein